MDDFVIKFIPGSVGAIFNSIVGHPFDTIRVIQQDINGKDKTIRNVVNEIIKNDGIKGIFRGIGPSMFGLMTETSTVFACNDILNKYVCDKYKIDRPSFKQDLLIGSLSGFFASIVSCPFETIKCNLQVNPNYKIKFTPKLYNGITSICLRNIPLYTCFIPIYNKSLSIIQKEKKATLFENGMAGGFTGMISWFIIYPFDVIKCNQQISTKKYNMYNTIRNMVLKNGIKSLYSGLSATMIRAFPSNFALLTGVEIGRKLTTQYK